MEDNDIVFYELPYGVATEALMEEIGIACDEERITGVKNIRNESNRKGFRLVIECEKNASITTILNKLFKETSLQTSFSYNQVALVDKTPKELGLKECIEIYVKHNSECIRRETEFDLNKAKSKLEIVEGLLKALEDIDNIIEMIKKSESAAAAKVKLSEKYGFTSNQAHAIVEMKLGKLAGLEKIEIQNEKKDLLAQIDALNLILEDTVKELRNRLVSLVAVYGDERRTEITHINESNKEEKEIEFVEPEKCVVVMTKSGLIKRIPSSSFRTQKRNGKGVKTKDDIVNAVIRTNTIDSLMIFTDKGKMYRLLVNDIPVGTNSTKGQTIRSLINMEPNEEPAVMYSIYRDTDAKYVLFVTKKGLVKKTSLEEYMKTKKATGIIAINLKEDDELAAVSLIKDENLVLITHNGMSIKFSSKEIPNTSRTTSGVKGITLKEDDYVVSALPVRNEEDNIAYFSSSGLAKKILMKELPVQKRAGKGLICYKEEVASATLVSDEDNILLIGDNSSICISAKDIPLMGRPASGNQMIKNSKIISVSKV